MAEDVLRILHVSPYVIPDPTLGGVPQSVRSTCQELSQAGHDVTVWGSDAGNPAGSVGRRADPNPQPQLFRARFKALSTVLNTPVVPELMLLSSRMVEDFDVVHFHGYWSSFTPSIAFTCRRARVPFVLQPRGSWVMSSQKEILKSVFQYLFRQRIIDCTSLAIALTPNEKSQLASGGFPTSS